jgi:hypothetical protein
MKMFRLLAWLLVWSVAILCSVGIWRDLLRFSRISPDSGWHLRAHSARLRDFCSRKIAETGGGLRRLRPCSPVVAHGEAEQ